MVVSNNMRAKLCCKAVSAVETRLPVILIKCCKVEEVFHTGAGGSKLGPQTQSQEQQDQSIDRGGDRQRDKPVKGLSDQGETQDDGVTLNKYSSALANVGIQIIDANGNLKEMDKILDEMGSK